MDPSETAAVGMMRIRAALLGALLPALALALPPPAWAQTPPDGQAQLFTFDIPAGPLGTALSRFAVATGHQLLAESHLVADIDAILHDLGLETTLPTETARHINLPNSSISESS